MSGSRAVGRRDAWAALAIAGLLAACSTAVAPPEETIDAGCTGVPPRPLRRALRGMPGRGRGTCAGTGINGSGLCSYASGYDGDACGECEPNRFGPSCQACPGGVSNACSSQGDCDWGVAGTGECLCEVGWLGATCSEPEQG